MYIYIYIFDFISKFDQHFDTSVESLFYQPTMNHQLVSNNIFLFIKIKTLIILLVTMHFFFSFINFYFNIIKKNTNKNYTITRHLQNILGNVSRIRLSSFKF